MINIEAVLNESEKINLEVKKASGGIPNSLWDTYSAFANTFGGTIILGIEENPTTKQFIPCGIQNPQKMLSDLWNTLNNSAKVSSNILLDNHIYVADYQELQFIVIEVPRAERQEKPVYIGANPFNGTFRRNHEGDYHCKREEVLAMIRDQSIESVDSKVLENLNLADLNAESIQRYRTMFRNIKNNHVWTQLGDEEFLLKIGAAKRGSDHRIHPTLAGLLFFGDFMTIMDELPNYFLDYRERLSTDTRWSDRITSGDGNWSGNIFDFYFKIIDRMTSDVKKPFKLNQNLLREDNTPVHAGLRESLANCLIHADYYGRCGIVIDKEFRKITISNPGTFRINIETAIAGGISDARNSRIFNMFSLINVGERSGSGLCDIFHTWEQSGYKKPVINETLNPDRISITLEIETGNQSTSDDVIDVNSDVNCDVNDVNSNVIDVNNDVNHTINDKERLILSYLASHQNATIKELSDSMEVGRATIDRILKKLKQKELLSRTGSTRKPVWIVNTKN